MYSLKTKTNQQNNSEKEEYYLLLKVVFWTEFSSAEMSGSYRWEGVSVRRNMFLITKIESRIQRMCVKNCTSNLDKVSE